MKRVRIFGVFGAVFLLILLSACTGKAPQAVASPTSFDFGEIGPIDPVSTTFTISNTGTAPLIIEGITTSCSCTAAEISEGTIAPDGSATLTVTFDPQVHDGATGHFLRYAYLQTNDPENPELKVEITLDVVENKSTQETN